MAKAKSKTGQQKKNPNTLPQKRQVELQQQQQQQPVIQPQQASSTLPVPPAAPAQTITQPVTLAQPASPSLPLLPTGGTTAIQPVKVVYPEWPTSKPGPWVTPPPPGMKSFSALRPEQLDEVDYNQVTGEPGDDSLFRSLPDAEATGPTSFDQPTAQDVLGKRKKRL